MNFQDYKTTRPQDYETRRRSRAHVVACSRGHAFTLVEMLVTLVLLSLIVLALMAVFNSTQNAFRASLTQTDILESGRMAMGLIARDLETMTPSYGTNYGSGPVNFYVNTNYDNPPLIQSLTASPDNAQRTNLLENFFILSRQNVNGRPSWVGTGYAVVTNTPDGGFYSLYRFTTNYPVMDGDPAGLFNTNFYEFLLYPTNYSHLLDGVVDLTIRAYDPNGLPITNTYNYYNGQAIPNRNTSFLTPASGVVGFAMYSNTVPASVEVQMGVLEDTTLQHLEGIPDAAARMNYLSNHVGQVHLFRQRVWIRNVDPAAYQ